MSYHVKVKPLAVQHRQSQLDYEKDIEKNFLWSLEPITRVIGLIGISRPLVDGHLLRPFSRAFSFLLVASIQFGLVIHIFQNAKNVSKSYIMGVTSASSWNFIIDNLNLAFYTIGGNIVLLMLTRPRTWQNLIKSFELLEKNLTTREIYPKCRQISVKAVIYIFVSVNGELYACMYRRRNNINNLNTLTFFRCCYWRLF